MIFGKIMVSVFTKVLGIEPPSATPTFHYGGRALVEYAEQMLRSRSVEYLEVKTLGPSRPNEHYERTRGFYFTLGFRPLEENQLWGEFNPCLIMIKHLRGQLNGAS